MKPVLILGCGLHRRYLADHLIGAGEYAVSVIDNETGDRRHLGSEKGAPRLR